MTKFIKVLSAFFITYFVNYSLYACQFEDCENLCDRTYIGGGVPLWTCAEKCAICKG